MAAIKEKDLPNASTINTTDYVRVVESGGASKKAPGSVIYSGMITLDTTAAAGTTDGDLYRAIHALGWDDVIEGGPVLNVKKLFTEMLTIKNVTPNNVSDFMTVNAGYTVTSLSVYKYGRLLAVNFVMAYSSQMAANSTYQPGTIKSGYRPIVSSGGASATFKEIVATDGIIYVRPTSAVGAGSAEAFAMIYFCE